MRTPPTPVPNEDEPGTRPACEIPTDTVDLRPFARIGCVGPDGAKADFLAEIAGLCRDHAEIFSLPGALDTPPFDRVRSLFKVTASNDRPFGELADSTTSLVLLSADLDQPAIVELDRFVPLSVTLRVLSLNAHPDAEALIAFDESGGRQFFVRPELRDINPERLASRPPRDTLFDKGPSSPGVAINFLGPVALSGTDYPIERHPKLTELVVFLALHPDGSTSRSWTAALWPDRRVPQQTINNRLSEARRIVGFAADGRPRLRRNGERHLLVEFGSDWREFQSLAGSREQSDWKSALSLVRGRPFDDLAQGQWVVFEGFLAEVEHAITSVAIRLGDLALAEGDPELCAWAANQALRACPFDERLHRLLMRSADALGNRAGVESTLRQLALILEIEGDPLRGVHPKTAELYGELTNSVASRG